MTLPEQYYTEVSAHIIKKQLIDRAWTCFNAHIACDEVKYCDVLMAIQKSGKCQLVEMEVKMSLSDLRVDIKKDKWRRYITGKGMIPNKYYFVMPIALCDKALPIIRELYPFAGLYSFRQAEMPFKLVKRARIFHNEPISIGTYHALAQAMYFRYLNTLRNSLI